MSEKAVEREIRDGLIHAIEFKEKSIDRKIRYVYIKNKHLTPSAKAFLSLIDND